MGEAKKAAEVASESLPRGQGSAQAAPPKSTTIVRDATSVPVQGLTAKVLHPTGHTMVAPRFISPNHPHHVPHQRQLIEPAGVGFTPVATSGVGLLGILSTPDKPTGLVRRGDTFPLSLEAGAPEMKWRVEGHDYQGRPVLINPAGKEMVVADEGLRRAITPDTPSTFYSELHGAQVVKAPPHFAKIMDAALSRPIVSDCSAQDYLEAYRERGFEGVVLGGAVRDVVHGFTADPNISIEKGLTLMQDIDVTVPCHPQVAYEVYEQFHGHETDKVKIEGAPEYGSVHWKDKKNSEGFDHNCTMIGSKTYDAKVVRVPGENATAPAVFGHSLTENVKALDFCCNTLCYDPENEVIVDPTGMGISDAQSKFLRLTDGETILNNPDKSLVAKQNNLFVRFWKFRNRDYTSNAFTTQTFLDQAQERWSSHVNEGREIKMFDEIGKALPLKKLSGSYEERLAQAEKMLGKFEHVLNEDDSNVDRPQHLYTKFIMPRREALLQYLVGRTMPMTVEGGKK